MPPKAKFTKQQIVEAGLDIIREEGMEYLTARALGKRLKSSACPIFTVFKNMEEVQAEINKAARAVYSKYVKKGLEEESAFKGVGLQYVMFAMEEPRLFQLLFMSEQSQQPSGSNILPVLDDNYEAILSSVQNRYALSKEKAERLYKHLWIYTHGIAVLCATNTCTFTADEIASMSSEVFKGTLKEMKGAEQ